MEETRKYPTIIGVHPGVGVKEQKAFQIEQGIDVLLRICKVF